MSDNSTSQLIAEKLGYSVVDSMLIGPGIEADWPVVLRGSTVEEWWLDAFQSEWIDNYESDTNSAIDLLNSIGERWNISGTPSESDDSERYRCEIQDYGRHVGYSATVPLAICRAWLKWYDATNAPSSGVE